MPSRRWVLFGTGVLSLVGFAAIALTALMVVPASASGMALSGAHAAPGPNLANGKTGGQKGHGGGGGGSCTGTTPGTSTNWAGYADETCLASPANNAVSMVQGTWSQPSVTCGSAETSYSAFWVGIDGYSSNSVEQIGTDSDCSGGTPSYYAWYEMYPKFPVNLANPVQPGDVITGTVHYSSSGQFVLTLQDQGKWTYTTSQNGKHDARSSAEWIAEAPSGSGGVLPLSDFGSVSFSACTTTINGVTGSISSPDWQTAELTMVTSGGAAKATPSSLSGGDAFSVAWNHN